MSQRAARARRLALPRARSWDVEPLATMQLGRVSTARRSRGGCRRQAATCATTAPPAPPAGHPQSHDFIKAATPHLVPVLLEQLTKQEEGQEQDESIWNLAMSSGTCLGLIARVAGNDVVPVVGCNAALGSCGDWRVMLRAQQGLVASAEGISCSGALRPAVGSKVRAECAARLGGCNIPGPPLVCAPPRR